MAHGPLLLAEALVWLAVAQVALKLVPYRTFARSLGRLQRGCPVAINAGDQVLARRVADAVTVMSRYTPWQSRCLAQATAAQLMLRGHGVATTLYLGVDLRGAGGVAAHAWLQSGGMTLTGGDSHERFAVMAHWGATPPDQASG
jgi:hypothetical protein